MDLSQDPMRSNSDDIVGEVGDLPWPMASVCANGLHRLIVSLSSPPQEELDMEVQYVSQLRSR